MRAKDIVRIEEQNALARKLVADLHRGKEQEGQENVERVVNARTLRTTVGTNLKCASKGCARKKGVQLYRNTTDKTTAAYCVTCKAVLIGAGKKLKLKTRVDTLPAAAVMPEGEDSTEVAASTSGGETVAAAVPVGGDGTVAVSPAVGEKTAAVVMIANLKCASKGCGRKKGVQLYYETTDKTTAAYCVTCKAVLIGAGKKLILSTGVDAALPAAAVMPEGGDRTVVAASTSGGETAGDENRTEESSDDLEEEEKEETLIANRLGCSVQGCPDASFDSIIENRS